MIRFLHVHHVWSLFFTCFEWWVIFKAETSEGFKGPDWRLCESFVRDVTHLACCSCRLPAGWNWTRLPPETTHGHQQELWQKLNIHPLSLAAEVRLQRSDSAFSPKHTPHTHTHTQSSCLYWVDRLLLMCAEYANLQSSGFQSRDPGSSRDSRTSWEDSREILGGSFGLYGG